MEVDEDVVRDHLHFLSDSDLIPMSHKNYVKALCESGVRPKVIYDIGACVLHWTKFARTLWPDVHVVAFEALENVEFIYKEVKNVDYHIGVLGDQDGKEIKFYENIVMPGGNSYYRENNDNVFPADMYRVVKMCCLDRVVKERGFPDPDLIKIDVQGCEKDVIAGGIETIKKAKHLIVEIQHANMNIGAPMADVVVPYIESLGFKCVTPQFSKTQVDGDYHFVNLNL